jgi:hypothetical protein
MARGTAVGEKPVSQAQTNAWDENADRIGLGQGESAHERGMFVWDPIQQKLVRPDERVEEERAIDAPIMVDRFYEGVPSPIDGTVFQSRRQHRQYMKDRGLTTTDDYDKPGGYWDRAEQRRAAPFSTAEQHRDRQERIGRRLYEVLKMPQEKYDREVREIARRRAERGPAVPTQDDIKPRR